MTSDRFNDLFGAPPRKSESILGQREMDLAASIQAVTEEVVIKLAKGIKKSTGLNNLCLAGGVALNCVANGKLLRENVFDKIWIQPASGDAGGAVGAALAAYYLMLAQPRKVDKQDSMQGSYLGPEFGQAEIEQRLSQAGAKFDVVSDTQLIDQTAQALADGLAVGWHQGRMEFGPRSLGARSIIADARSPTVQKQLNLKVKYRESFRPFAPSILREDVADWFEINTDSPYMLLVADVKKEKQLAMTEAQKQLFGIEKLNVPRSEIPAVTHVDYSARIQTVSKETNPKYHALISKFKEITGCPVLVNTSFNVRGEPIVCSPEDAFNCLMGTDIDFLVVGNCILRKEQQNQALVKDYKNAYELD
jgi:carbamoyltransferase